jgi:hypothetical protein
VRIRSRRRTLSVLASAALVLLIGVQPVAATTLVSKTGVVGSYSLTDAATPAGSQGVTCAYDLVTYHVTSITVRHPSVKARNRTSGRDSQWVGWQYIVQHETPSGTTWQTIYASSFRKAVAKDNLAAAFANRVWPAPADPTGRYRVLIVIRWYAPGSSSVIEGQVKLRDAFYQSTWNGNSVISPDFCLQDY